MKRARIHQSELIKRRIKSASAQKNHWDKFKETNVDIQVEPALAPGTKKHHENAQRALFGFTEQYLKCKNLQCTVSDFLKEPPKRPFWKLYLRYLTLPKAHPTTSSGGVLHTKDDLGINTVLTNFRNSIVVYRKLFKVDVDKDDLAECMAMWESAEFRQAYRLRWPQIPAQASFEDCRNLLRHGAFGSTVLFKNARERTQFACLILVLAFTAARPGEIVCCTGYEATNEGLHYGDLTFSLEKLEDDSLSLAVDVKIRNLKGHRGDATYFRTQPIYQDSKNLAPLHDATLMLVVLALEDEVFEDVRDIDEIFSIDPQRLEQALDPKLNRKRTLLVMKDNKKSLPVLRQPTLVEGRWEIDDRAIWRYNSALCILRYVAAASGMDNFTFYSIRHACATVMNCMQVTETSAQLVMGHAKGTSTYANHYVSKRTLLDIQGLVSAGKESRERMTRPPMQRLPLADLSIADLESVEQEPELVRARSDLEQHRQTLYSSHSDEFTSHNVTSATDIPRSGQFHCDDAVSESLKKALTGYQKAARRVYELRLLLRQRLRQRRSLENLREKQKGAIASSISQSRAQAELLIDLASATEDVGEAVTSNLLANAMDEGVESRMESIANPPSADAIKVAAVLDTIKTEVDRKLGAKSKFTDLLQIRADMTIAVRELYDSLTSGYGTRTTKLSEHCPTCKALTKTESQAMSHYRTCTRQYIVESCNVAVAEILCAEGNGRQCTHSPATSTNENDGCVQCTMKYVKEHAMFRTSCNMKCTDGAPCRFSATSGEPHDADHSQYAIHMLQVHGIVNLSRHNVIFCEEHMEWLVGDVQTEEHFALHVKANMFHELPADLQCQTCPYCWNNVDVRPSKRAKTWDGYLAVHIINCHLTEIMSPKSQCPICSTEQPLELLADHLIDHGYYLAGHSEIVDVPRHCHGNMEALKVSWPGAMNMKRLEKWIAYVESLVHNV